MPISPYYKRLYTELAPDQDSVNGQTNQLIANDTMTQPDLPDPNEGSDVNMPSPDSVDLSGGKSPYSLGVTQEPASQATRLNVGADISSLPPSQFDSVTGLQNSPKAPSPGGASPADLPQFQMADVPGMNEGAQRDRMMLSALADFSAGVGNVKGTPTATTVPAHFQKMNEMEQQFYGNQLARQKTSMEIGKMQQDLAIAMRKRDPNSLESQQAREFINRYFGQYVGGKSIPENVSAEQIEKFVGPLSTLGYNQQKAAIEGQLYGQKLQGEQSIEEQKLKGQMTLEDIKARMELLRQQNTVESNRQLKELELQTGIKLKEMQIQGAKDVANIRANATKGKGNAAGQYQANRLYQQDRNSYLNRTKVVQKYREINEALQKLKSAAAMNTGVGDLAVIFSNIIGQNPGVAVRASEIGLTEAAQGSLNNLRMTVDKVKNGQMFTPETKANMINNLANIKAIAADELRQVNNAFIKSGQKFGYDPTDFLVDPDKESAGGGGAGRPGASGGTLWVPPSRQTPAPGGK